jgi:hypothetical protein
VVATYAANGMRRVSAEVGHSVTWGFSVLLVVLVPPVQVAFTVIPTLIAWACRPP